MTETQPDEPAVPRSATEVLEDSTDLYKRKNADYGDSWKLVGKIFALILEHNGQDELVIPADENVLNSLGLFFRRGDKFVREFNGWFMADEMQVSESIAETHGDDVPYGAMHTELAETVARIEDDSERNDLIDALKMAGFVGVAAGPQDLTEPGETTVVGHSFVETLQDEADAIQGDYGSTD